MADMRLNAVVAEMAEQVKQMSIRAANYAAECGALQARVAHLEKEIAALKAEPSNVVAIAAE